MAAICIYGSSRENIDRHFIQETERLGKMVGERGHSLVYGAGATGLMGAAARGIREAGGDVIGVAPHFMHKFEPIFDCTRTIETKTMAERKSVMEKTAEAFIVAPGGVGTLDEFFQILTLKELGLLDDKPIIIFNIDGFYDTLRDMMKSLNERGFLRENLLDMFTICNTADEAVEELERQL